jgi:hypothetical protein
LVASSSITSSKWLTEREAVETHDDEGVPVADVTQ